jgi:uncharacterized protein YhaN
MRIERLDLIRYGRFTDCSVDFSAPGLHLVVGPNEAGKSTMRDAVADLLYGIPRQTSYGYLHDKRDLRIGGLLRAHDGRTLEVLRLKRDRESLRTTGDAKLEQSELDAILAGVTRDDFTTTFAIDHEELRRGGTALLLGEGDLGKALFESRSSAQLTVLLNRLREEHEQLFVPRGKVRELNVAVSPDGPHAAARRLLADSMLRPDMYQLALQQVDEARKADEGIAEQLRRAREEQARLTRIQQAYAGMQRRVLLQQEHAVLTAEGPHTDEGTSRRYEDLRSARQKAQVEAETIDDGIASIRARLDALHPDETVLRHADQIRDLSDDSKSVARAEKQALQAQQAADAQRKEADARLAKARPGQDLITSADLVPATVRTQADELAKRKLALETELRGARKNLGGRDRALARALSALDSFGTPNPHLGTLRAVVKSVPAQLADRILLQEGNLKSAEQKLGKSRKRYSRFALPPGATEVPVPDEDEIAAHRKRVDAAEKAMAKAQDQYERCEAELGEHRRALDLLLRQDPPPTEAELEATRGRRDRLWGGLRERLTDASHVQDAQPPVREYESAVEASDRAADRMRREAERLADRKKLEESVARAARELAVARQHSDVAGAVLEGLNTQWLELWSPSGLPAAPVETAAALLTALRTLREQSDECDRIRLELDAEREQAVAHASRLRAALSAAGAEPPDASAPLSVLLETATEFRSTLDDAAKKRAVAQTQSESLRDEVATATSDVERIEADLVQWRQQWDALLAEHGLDGSPEQVVAVLTELDEIAELYRDADRDDEVAGNAARQVEEFTRKLNEVLVAVGREPLSDLNRRYSETKALKDYLDRQVKAQDERVSLTSELEEKSRKAQKAREDERAQNEAVSALLVQHRAADEPELKVAIERGANLRDLRKQIEAVELALSGGGVGLAQLEQEVAEHDPDQLAAAIADLAASIDELEGKRSEAASRLALEENGLRQMDGSAAAAAAADSVEHELALIAHRARVYLRLRLAERILLDNIEAYRRENQTPVLRSAAGNFAGITRGAFPELVDDVALDGRPILRARRASGEQVDVKEMSEGTRDQLYFALRLASLERYRDQGRAMPLLLDDILMTFDDGRTGAGLALLDELADRFQIVVFTHHDHIGRLAQGSLPSGRVHIHDITTTPGSAAVPAEAAP